MWSRPTTRRTPAYHRSSTTLKGMKMSYPRPDPTRRKELESVRSTLANEKS